MAYVGKGKEFKVEKPSTSGWFALRLPNNQLGWVEKGEGIRVLGPRGEVIFQPPKAPPKIVAKKRSKLKKVKRKKVVVKRPAPEKKPPAPLSSQEMAAMAEELISSIEDEERETAALQTEKTA